jgi:hypothetical protein
MDTSTHTDQTRVDPPEETQTMALRSDTDDRDQDFGQAPAGRSGRRGLIWAVAVLAVLIIAGAVFAFTRGGGDAKPTPTAAATITDAARQAAIDDSWARAQKYTQLTDKAFQQASVEGIDLQTVAWPAVVDETTRFAEGLSRDAQHQTGSSAQSLISSDFAPATDPATMGDVAYGTVTLKICLDISQSDLVDNVTGQSIRVPAPGQASVTTRNLETVTAERNGGVWKVRADDIDYGTSC